MQRHIRGNLLVTQFNNGQNREAAIVTHGGYTPRRGFIRTGSGQSTVPPGITLNFYAPVDTVCVGTAAYWKISTGNTTNPIAEVCGPNTSTENYSLTYDEKVDKWTLQDTWLIDLITVHKDKVHLNDVWSAITALNLNYNVIYCFACRIDKLTYTGSIT